MRYGKVIKGQYIGREDKFTKPNHLGLVMFYPKEGKYPYRVCLNKNDVKEVIK